MSTRCNIIVRGKGKRTTLYRHYDGYPDYTGEDLKKALSETGTPYVCEFATKLIQRNDHGRFFYELTDGIHGDIEYLYVVRLVSRRIDCYEIPHGEERLALNRNNGWNEETLAVRSRRIHRWTIPAPNCGLYPSVCLEPVTE